MGKKQLEAGIALYRRKHPSSTDIFTTTWYPYQLNPNAPKSGIDKHEYLSSKFGPQRAVMMQSRLDEVGKSIGINFKFGGKTGHTKDSHRLIHLANETKGAEVQNRVVDEIEKSYFELEGDITSHDMLIESAVKAGLDETEVRGWLNSDAAEREVDQQVEAARKSGVTGVPNFVLQGRYEIGGAQDPEAFVKVFESIKDLEKNDS